MNEKKVEGYCPRKYCDSLPIFSYLSNDIDIIMIQFNWIGLYCNQKTDSYTDSYLTPHTFVNL